MKENKIKWCLKQKKGIELIDLKPHLSLSYMKEADDTLENMFCVKGKWKLITGYYACYNALYSLFMQSGVKCEIHECSLELMFLFNFDEKEIVFLNDLKEKRIKVQYYLENISLDDENKVKMFVFKCKSLLNNLNSEKIEKIRLKIDNLLNKN
jgi:hypothetical protein